MAFTLLELVVVIGIIAFLAVVTLPAVSRMIEDSKLADSENKIKGLLRSARSRAMNNEVAGLFFFLQDGVQRAVFIELEQDGTNPGGPTLTPQTTADRFRVLEGDVFKFPAPFRVVPRGVVTLDPDRNAPAGQMIWNDAELASDDYRDLPDETDSNGPQNHRNFFTILFSKEGHLLTRPVVLIHDGDAGTDADSSAAAGGEVVGTVTGLPVATVSVYQDVNGDGFPQFDPQSAGLLLDAMVNNGGTTNNAALNFASVDGLLVYDDSVFRDYPDVATTQEPTDKRQFLIDTGAPYYVSRQSGAVIPGPKGEGETVP